MQICQTHLEALRAALKLHNVDHLKAAPEDVECVLEHINSLVAGEKPADETPPFDSVIASQILIARIALNILGPEELEDTMEEPLCPLCALASYAPNADQVTIDEVAASIRTIAIQMGHVTKETVQ